MAMHSFILTAFLVSIGLGIDEAQSNNQMDTNIITGQVQGNFINLLDSIMKHDGQRRETYRDLLQEEAGNEQQVFDSMKQELRSARQRNVRKPDDFHVGGNKFKREDDDTPEVRSVLMVCSSNFALSPMAEAIFNDLAEKKNVSSQWRCDSAGISARASDYINANAAAVLKKHDVKLNNRTCRQLEEEDFNKYHFIFAMDREQLRDMKGLSPVGCTAEMELLTIHDPEGEPMIRTPDFWAPAEAYEEPFQTMNRSIGLFLDNNSVFECNYQSWN